MADARATTRRRYAYALVVLTEANTALRVDLAAERERNKTLARVAVELSLELEQAKEELAEGRRVVRLPTRANPS